MLKNQKLKVKNQKSGFTLIELMIVMTVMAILATIVLYGLGQAQKASRDQQRAQIVKGVEAALQAFVGDNSGSFPTGATWAAMSDASGVSSAVRLGTTYLPNPLTDPGCGGGTGGDMRGDANGIPGTGQCAAAGPPIYTYTLATAAAPLTGTCAGAQYQIVLTKESGGTQTFCGPK